MKNKLIIPCPYRSSYGFCSHKGNAIEKISKRCWCGHNKPTKCKFYLEWLKKVDIASLEEKTLLDPLKLKLSISNE